MRIPQYEIDRVLDAVSIEDVISDFVQLKREGARFKCCCPVHSENNPSFVVTPRMNIYKCFGCGISGNAISFLTKVQGMSYVEAVKYLAKKANISIDYEDRKLSAKEEEELRELESAKIVNEAVAEFFQDQLKADNPRAQFARKYAADRWGDKWIDIFGLGFAQGRGSLRAWAKERGFSEALLLKIGLLTEKDGKIYDTFFDRLMMPIRSRSNQVVGFTGRVLSDAKPKYINSKESVAFHKSSIIFGLNVATREAAKEGMLYLVEGAPDVYRLQILGASNAVASLGTAWSPEQFEQLRKYNATLCFIPDIDKIAQGENFGPGILSVMKNGKTAIKAGLRVAVKEMSPGENEKVDVDSNIHSREALEEILTEDFIVWYASKKVSVLKAETEKTIVLKDVCQLLAEVNDKDYAKILTKRLSTVLGVTTSIIQNAVNAAVKAKAEKKLLENEKLLDRELYSKYGFYERRNCYFSMNSDGIEQRWSNFTLSPLFHIKDQLNPKRIYRIKNISGANELIELKQEDLVSLQRFKLRTEGMGNYIWEAKDAELTKLKSFLYEKTESAVEITQLGMQRDGFFAFGNGAVLNGQWMPCDDLGIVRLPDNKNFYLPAASKIYEQERKLFQFERRFVHLNHSTISLKSYSDKLIEVFGDNAKVGLCFFLATLFKDIVTAKTKNFPILNLFGPKGSGKSELGHSLMSFFIINNEPPNLSSSTDAALAEAVAQCANSLVHIDEYKNSIELNRREFLKGLYDGVGRTRLNMDRDKKRETTAVDCGVILSGQEMPTIDIALFSRLVYLTFNTTDFSPKQKARFAELKQMRDLGCSHITIQLLQFRKKVEAEFNSNYSMALDDMQQLLQGESVETRIFLNWVTMLAIFRTLEGVLGLSFGYKEMLDICIEGIRKQNAVCKSTNELASFWQVVDYLHQNGEIFIDADYRIKFESSFKGKGTTDKIIFQEQRKVLYLCTKRVMMLYRKNGKVVGESTLPVESLRHYLEISKEFLGVKNAVRFKNVSNEIESIARETGPTGYTSVRQTTRVDWALCFDYSSLVENYGINLEIDNAADDDPDPTEIDENDNSLPY